MAAKTKGPTQHRATGRTYLAALSEACPPETWREIAEETVEDAKAGDYRARDWLASYLVGRPDGAAVTLHQIAVDDFAGNEPIEQDAMLASLFNM